MANRIPESVMSTANHIQIQPGQGQGVNYNLLPENKALNSAAFKGTIRKILRCLRFFHLGLMQDLITLTTPIFLVRLSLEVG
jgi:hypothetical protein